MGSLAQQVRRGTLPGQPREAYIVGKDAEHIVVGHERHGGVEVSAAHECVRGKAENIRLRAVVGILREAVGKGVAGLCALLGSPLCRERGVPAGYGVGLGEALGEHLPGLADITLGRKPPVFVVGNVDFLRVGCAQQLVGEAGVAAHHEVAAAAVVDEGRDGVARLGVERYERPPAATAVEELHRQLLRARRGQGNLGTARAVGGDVDTLGIVEKLVKEDFKAYYDSINALRENYDEVANIKALNIENYKNDGPEFNTTLETLNTIKTEDQNLIATLNDLIDETKIDEKASNNGLKGKYVQEYKDILTQIKLSDGVNKIKETDAKFDGYLNSLIDVLTYMKDNKDVWFIENDTLKSNSQTFIDEYNKKVDQTNIEL